MRIIQSFHVDTPATLVWRTLQDVRSVVECFPGLKLTNEPRPNVYLGSLFVKVGPATSKFEGEAEIVERDDQAMRAKIKAMAVDKLGGNQATSEVVYVVQDMGNSSNVEIEAHVKLTGAIAQLGRVGMIEDISSLLIERFSKSLNDMLSKNGGVSHIKDDKINSINLIHLFLQSILRKIKSVVTKIKNRKK